ncbi:2-dehydropantoate 2-reductase [Pontibacillus sp. HMF3514]|uniref:2-dehydropantoate 2-reductase n=1 Tax=Pontibacillus sp. HMF3514 TaxID=2692425 RepID=UPI0013200486|nr:2-dehydropantoate 2-reductase [Pontibacillus sp. HMF3514]QHE52090.1 2-dehydropantoate 2-reductase [Pontibacillus sp. HMF3514]
MNIGVIGGGAIGLLTSYYLHKKGHAVTLYVRRKEQMETIKGKRLHILPMDEKVEINTSLTNDLENQDVLIVCTKQQAVDDVIQILQDKHITCPLLFLQNGMGHIYKLQNLSNPLSVGVMEHGALRIDENTVKHTGKGKLRIAAMNMNNQELNIMKSYMNCDEFPVHIEGDWYNMLAKKLVINAVINPITALFQVKNGQVIENPFLECKAKRLCEEACLVLKLNPQKQWENVYQIAEFTKENTSSMAKDIQGKRETEVEAILGFLLHEATFDVPNIQYMYESIKAIEYSFKKEGEV